MRQFDNKKSQIYKQPKKKEAKILDMIKAIKAYQIISVS